MSIRKQPLTGPLSSKKLPKATLRLFPERRTVKVTEDDIKLDVWMDDGEGDGEVTIVAGNGFSETDKTVKDAIEEYDKVVKFLIERYSQSMMRNYGVSPTELGRGSFGIVYDLERPPFAVAKYAIKISQLKLFYDKKDTDMVGEITILKELKGHANIVEFIDCYPEDGLDPYFMIFYRHTTAMDVYLEQLPEPKSYAIVAHGLMKQITSAMVFAHEKGIVHGDIKPGNTLVDVFPDGRVFAIVADWGMAKRVREPQKMIWFEDEQSAYTSYFRPPEIYIDKGFVYGPASDVFALGCTFVCIIMCNQCGCFGKKLEDRVRMQMALGGKESGYAKRLNEIVNRFRGVYHEDAKIAELWSLMIDFFPKTRPTMTEVLETLEKAKVVKDKTKLEAFDKDTKALHENGSDFAHDTVRPYKKQPFVPNLRYAAVDDKFNHAVKVGRAFLERVYEYYTR